MQLENGNKVKGEKNKNKIKYKEIFNNIDLEYIVLSNKVKEQIIIKNKYGIKKQIVFNLKTDLKLKKENEELILFNKEKVFKIEKPFMNNFLCYNYDINLSDFGQGRLFNSNEINIKYLFLISKNFIFISYNF